MEFGNAVSEYSSLYDQNDDLEHYNDPKRNKYAVVINCKGRKENIKE